MDTCMDWLKAFLKPGAINCEEVKEAAARAGFTRKELREAKIKLGVVSGSITVWSIPEEEA